MQRARVYPENRLDSISDQSPDMPHDPHLADLMRAAVKGRAAIDAGLGHWIDFSAQYVGALPPK